MVYRIGRVFGDDAQKRLLDCNKGVEGRTKAVNLAEKSAKLAKEISAVLNGVDHQTTLEAARASQIFGEASGLFSVTNSFGKWSDVWAAGDNIHTVMTGTPEDGYIELSGKSSLEFRQINAGSLAQRNLALFEQTCKVVTAVSFIFAFGFCSPLRLAMRIHSKVHPILQNLGNKFTAAMNVNKGFSVLAASASFMRKWLRRGELGNDERTDLIYSHEATVDGLKVGEKGLALVGLISVSVFGWQMGKISLAACGVAASTLGVVRVYADSYRPPGAPKKASVEENPVTV